MKENLMLAVISALVGLLVGFLVWGTTSAWSTGQTGPAMMNANGMLSGAPVSATGMMGSGMMNGMMQGMGNMMGQGMMHSSEHGNMDEHMAQCAQCHEMMGKMHEHSHANPPDENK